jgi:hypothetical protein
MWHSTVRYTATCFGYIAYRTVILQQNATKYMCDCSFSLISVLVYHNGMSHVKILTVYFTGSMDTTCMPSGKAYYFSLQPQFEDRFFFLSAKCHHSGIIFHLSSTDEATRYRLNGSGSRASYSGGSNTLSRSHIRPGSLLYNRSRAPPRM